MGYTFIYNERLGISLPKLEMEWDRYAEQVQADIIMRWEKIRGTIPDRIADIEQVINKKQARLEVEEDFHTSCQLNADIAELASIINDLWIWYRMTEQVSVTT